MHQLEDQLNDLYTKKFPYQLPDNIRALIVRITPWLTLVGGIFSLIAVVGLYNAAVFVDRITSYLNSAYPYTYASPASISPLIWVSLLIMLVQAVIFLAAFPGLRARKKQGWNLLYLVSLLNVAYAISYLFVGYSFGSFVSSVIGSVIGLYFLFEIRGYYSAAGIPPVRPVARDAKKDAAATPHDPTPPKSA